MADPHEDDEVNVARQHLLERGMEPLLSTELKDIQLCNVQKVCRKLDGDDFRILNQFMDFPELIPGKIDIPRAREQLETFLKANPAFQSCNPGKVCSNIGHYFTLHPIKRKSSPPSPNWAKKYTTLPSNFKLNDEIENENEPSFMNGTNQTDPYRNIP